MYDIIESTFICAIICILFIFFVITDRSFDNKVKISFLITIGIVLLLVNIDNLKDYELTTLSSILAIKFHTAIGYSFRPTVAIAVTFIMFRNNKSRLNKKVFLYLLFLFILNAFLCFLSIYNNWVFGYNDDGTIFRGPLADLPYITYGFYTLSMIIVTICTTNVRHWSENVVIIIIGVISVIAMVMEKTFDMENILSTSMALNTVFYYLYIHVNIYSRDQLTRMYNRHIFYLDLKKIKKNAVIVSLDLNMLKQINDKKGHMEGDKVLLFFSKTINENLHSNCTLYRVGGDEFEIICKKMTLEEVENMMQNILNYLSEYSVFFAYGCVTYDKSKNIESVCKEADKKMYAMKEVMKHDNN